MPPITPGAPDQSIPLGSRFKLKPSASWSGSADLSATPGAVLSPNLPAAGVTAPLSIFTPAEPPITLDIRPTPSAVLSADDRAELEYEPQDNAVYALLQEVITPAGTIYDFTLPIRPDPPAGPAVLGPLGGSNTLRFPVNSIALDGARPTPGVLGIDNVVGGVVANVVIRRVLQVIKSPIDAALLSTISQIDQPPRVLALHGNASAQHPFQALDDAAAWRALLPPGAERRVLLLIHGFGSSTIGTGGDVFLPQLAQSYDAVLSYDHPTITRDPLQNAQDLLAMIPEDLRLSADIIAHSRGGLVARSLVELVKPMPQWSPRRVITHGSPHSGTPLAEPLRWDRLVSIGMTAASWLATTLGAAFWAPRVLELVLKAAAQSIFSLPGIMAMTPDSAFLKELNTPSDIISPAAWQQSQTQYAAITSTFNIFRGEQPGFQQACQAFAAQAFIEKPNDLVVPTASMSAIDLPSKVLTQERTYRADIDHFSYFRDEGVMNFLREQLGMA